MSIASLLADLPDLPGPSSSSSAADPSTVVGPDMEEEDEFWTPTELLNDLTRAFLDEAAAPKLLPEKLEMADKMVAQMAEMDKVIAGSSTKNSVMCSAHRMELYRIEHVVNSYLRVRLKKIEANPQAALRDHAARLHKAMAAKREGKPPMDNVALLDAREVQFARALMAANGALLADAFLVHIPANMQYVPVPNPASAGQQRVFVEVLKDNLDQVAVPSMADPNADIMVSMDKKGGRHLLPFHCVEELLDRGDIALL